MEDLNDMLYFAEVAERGGVAAAARALGVPKSRLSRRGAAPGGGGGFPPGPGPAIFALGNLSC